MSASLTTTDFFACELPCGDVEVQTLKVNRDAQGRGLGAPEPGKSLKIPKEQRLPMALLLLFGSLSQRLQTEAEIELKRLQETIKK